MDNITGLLPPLGVNLIVEKQSQLHGTGLFATEGLEAGSEIFAEQPIVEFLLPESNELPPDEIVDNIRNLHNDDVRVRYPIAQFLSTTFTQMSERRFIEVSKDQALETVRAFVNAAKTAALPYASRRSDGWAFLCKTASKFNHSCRPNAEVSWDDERQLVVATATRKIEEGQEIVISYIDEICRRRKRSERLGFECRCPECRLSYRDFTICEIFRVAAEGFEEAVLAFRGKYGKHSKEMWTVTDAEATQICHDKDSKNLLDVEAQCLPSNTHFRSFLAIATDTIAAIYTASAMVRDGKKDRANAIRMKLFEMGILERCLGMHNRRTKQTRKQVDDMEERATPTELAMLDAMLAKQ